MKKTLSFLLLLAMLALPAAFAEEAPLAFVSISDDTGTLVLAHMPVTLADLDGDGAVTICDALTAAHGTYHSQGTEAFLAEKTEWGLSMYRLWNVENGGSYGYCLNDAFAMSLLDPVKAGDHVKAYAFTDLSGFTDTYCFFDASVMAAKAGETISLTLNAAGYDEAWNPVTLPAAGALITVNGVSTDVITDENGSAALTLTGAGTYVVSAVSDTQTLVPPVCMVKIAE